MNQKVELSKRLTLVSRMVTVGNTVADIGCDHGFVSIYLVVNNISPHVIAMDINKGPLEIAMTHIREYGMEKYIEARRSDGTRMLNQGEADTIICAGIGGRLMVKILDEGSQILAGVKEIILQPQSDIEMVRKYLREHNFRITAEEAVFEEGKYYFILKCIHDEPESVNTEIQILYDKFGPKLIQNRNTVLLDYLRYRQLRYQEILIDMPETALRYNEIQEELSDIGKALQLF